MTARNLIKYVLGLALAVLLLAWVVRGTDPQVLLEHLSRVSVPGLLLCGLLNLGHNVIRVWRWRALLTPVRPNVPFRPMFAAIIVGYMTSWLIPGRIGELVRPLALSGQQELPLGPCLGSIVGDRLLDAAAVVFFFAIGAWLSPPSGAAAEYAVVIQSGAVSAAIAVIVVLAVMLLMSTRIQQVEGWLQGRSGPVAWVIRTMMRLSKGVSALRSPRLLVLILLYTGAAWLMICAATWVGIRATGAEIDFAVVLFIMPMLVLGIAIPTPGGAGSYHGLMKVGLMLFGVSEVAAVGAGLMVHLAITLPVVLLGLAIVWSDALSLKDLLQGARKLREMGNADDALATAESDESRSVRMERAP